MSAAQVHLAFGHFPIAGTIFAIILLIWGLSFKKEEIKLAGIALLIISAVSSIIVFNSGEGAEEIVEHRPLVTKELIHDHEESAEAAMIALQISALLGLGFLGMRYFNKNHQQKIFILIIVANLISIGLITNAAHKGGLIRHDELRN